jgi:hypothetical protein
LIVGGSSLADQGKSSFFFDIKVVDETNTKAQKAEYVREAFAAFKRLLSDCTRRVTSTSMTCAPRPTGTAVSRRSFAITTRRREVAAVAGRRLSSDSRPVPPRAE